MWSACGSQGGKELQTAVHLQVSQATAAARAAVEAAGGSVTTVYYNKLGAARNCSGYMDDNVV